MSDFVPSGEPTTTADGPIHKLWMTLRPNVEEMLEQMMVPALVQLRDEVVELRARVELEEQRENYRMSKAYRDFIIEQAVSLDVRPSEIVNADKSG